jgi:uncharacterized flavoprotein (TIGR03862 family)
MSRKTIIVAGSGPAGLMAADVLSRHHQVILLEKQKNLSQKFLLAGKGGFNLTNILQGNELVGKYSPQGFLDNALAAFGTTDFRKWLLSLGIATFEGSSGRVFPAKDIKPSDVLKVIHSRILAQGVRILTNHNLVRFTTDNQVVAEHMGEQVVFNADYLFLALGGASWPSTGSDGSWSRLLESMGVSTNPFQASNCGININWPDAVMIHAGKPVKNISLSCAGFHQKGEMVITEYGLEGNAVYPLVPAIRKGLIANQTVPLYIDFKPQNTVEQLVSRLDKQMPEPKKYAGIFNLDPVQLALLKAYTSKEVYLSASEFTSRLKGLPVPVDSLRPVEEAISTVGGIRVDELNNDFSLKKYPWVYTLGEMVDWDAPTGGFLIQGCVSMAYHAAQAVLHKISGNF